MRPFHGRLLHVILICKSLHVRRSPWIPFPSPHRAKLASTCARHAMLRVSPVQPSLKKPVFRSAWLASLELGDATGIRLDKLLAVFGALGLALVAQGNIDDTKHEQPTDAPHADLQPCSTPRCHHTQRLHHRNRRGAAIPALPDTPFTAELYDKAFADFAMSNLGVSIAASASAQTKPEGR